MAADPMLVVLVATVDRADELEVGVTLMVGGVVVCGTLVSEPSFHAGVLHQIGTALQRETGLEDLWEHFDGLAREKRALIEHGVEAGDPDALQAPELIHLKDAYVPHVTGRTLPSRDGGAGGMYWRGRLDQVDGWSFGSIGRPADSS